MLKDCRNFNRLEKMGRLHLTSLNFVRLLRPASGMVGHGVLERVQSRATKMIEGSGAPLLQRQAEGDIAVVVLARLQQQYG